MPWKLFIPIQNRPLEFINYEFFHPTFLYESLWNFLIFIVLIIIFNKQNKTDFFRPGFISCLYLISYSFGRFWIEGLRTDPLCIGGLPPFCDGGIRMAQFISIFLFSSGLIGIFFLRLRTYSGKIERMDKKISFIGVGPGDPELLTLKALKKIKIADVIIWTDSLIPEKILDFSKEGSEKIKTSSLNLEQITSIMIEKFQAGKTVVRLHDGDPCLFGAIREQIEILKRKIEIEVVPGVSAFQVAAAYHEAELTIPDVTQTIILTRAGGEQVCPKKNL